MIPTSDLLELVLGRLSVRPMSLASHPEILYSPLGAHLYGSITQVGRGYYLTACEREILEEGASDMAASLPRGNVTVCSLGPGDGHKEVGLLRALLHSGRAVEYRPIDVCATTNAQLADQLSLELPRLNVVPVNDTFVRGLRTGATRSFGGTRVICFWGSTLGNYPSRLAANQMLGDIRDCMDPGDRLWMGLDLTKDQEIIRGAYDDVLKVTAGFNLAAMMTWNELLGANFDLRAWEHRYVWNEVLEAAESYLVSLHDQEVNLGGDVLSFKAGETIHMETSIKFRKELLDDLAAHNGFRQEKVRTDSKGWYAVTQWVAA